MSGMNKQGRPTSIGGTSANGARETFTGNKALELE